MIFPADTNLVRILGFTSIHRFLCTGPPQTAEPGLCLGWDNLPRFGALCQVHSLLGGLRARTFHLHRFHLGIHWVDEWLQTVRLQWDRDTYAVVSPRKSESIVYTYEASCATGLDHVSCRVSGGHKNGNIKGYTPWTCEWSDSSIMVTKCKTMLKLTKLLSTELSIAIVMIVENRYAANFSMYGHTHSAIV